MNRCSGSQLQPALRNRDFGGLALIQLSTGKHPRDHGTIENWRPEVTENLFEGWSYKLAGQTKQSKASLSPGIPSKVCRLF